MISGFIGLRTDNNIRRKHRSYGYDKSLQRIRYRRRRGTVDHLFFHWEMTTLISTIPGPVIGGISFLLYGMIGTSGIRILVDSQVDYARSRNMAMTSIIFVTGLSGIKVQFGSIQLTGMVLACVVGMIMGLMFFLFDKLKLTNDRENC